MTELREKWAKSYSWLRKRWPHIAVIVALTLVESLHSWGRTFSDSEYYLAHARMFMGEEVAGPIVPSRFLLPLLASILGRVMPLTDAFALLNLAFWLAAAVVAYVLVERLLDSRTLALVAAVLFTASDTLIYFGASVLTNTPAYLFTGLGVLLALRATDHEDSSIGRWGRDLGVLALGAIIHPEVVLAAVFYVVWRVLQMDPKERRTFGTRFAFVSAGGVSLLSIGLWLDIGLAWVLWQGFLGSLGWLFTSPDSVTAQLLAGNASALVGFAWNFGLAFLHLPDIGPLLYVGAPIVTLIGFLSMDEQPRGVLLVALAVYAPILFSLGSEVGMTGRVIFSAWPAILPAVVVGLAEIAETGADVLDRAWNFRRNLSGIVLGFGVALLVAFNNLSRGVFKALLG